MRKLGNLRDVLVATRDDQVDLGIGDDFEHPLLEAPGIGGRRREVGGVEVEQRKVANFSTGRRDPYLRAARRKRREHVLPHEVRT